jgi:hypothetical protein
MILLDWTKPASMVRVRQRSVQGEEADLVDKRAVVLAVVDHKLGRRINRQ